ncbi:MAG TPA: protein arginine kinase [Planctomycetota bacterium]|nr:protein arginine kinase [Planctomycetota bacterium]
MQLRKLADNLGEWLGGTGPESDVVISSRVRLARNLERFNFPARLDVEARAECAAHIRERIIDSKAVAPDGYFPLEERSATERHFLVERHLISREHEDGGPGRAVAVGEDEVLSIMVLEEDHIRLQILKSGLQPLETWRIANSVDDLLDRHLDYAFNPQLGYLTSCPTNLGTGMRVSVMLHLPALVLTRHIAKCFQAMAKIGLNVRGLYGEGTEATGDFYQISNQSTLGKTEEGIVHDLTAVVPEVLKYERNARKTLLRRDRQRIEDRVWRAYGMLRHARVLSSEETMTLLSALRLGVHTGIIEGLEPATVNELFIYSQPAHLQIRAGREIASAERDVLRADFVRGHLPAL